MKVLITGLPGCGKTTLCQNIAEKLKGSCSIGGIISAEIRERGIRKGFKIIDIAKLVRGSHALAGAIATQREGILAHVEQRGKTRIGKYVVNLEDLNGIGAEAVRNAAENCDLVIIDEIGPMELQSKSFVEAVRRVFESDKNVLATIHYKSKHQLVEELKKNHKLYEINSANRGNVLQELLSLYAKSKKDDEHVKNQCSKGPEQPD